MKTFTWIVVLGLVLTGAATARDAGMAEPPQAGAAACVDLDAEGALAAALEGGPELGTPEAYTPPPCVGLFTDVPCSNPFAAWIEQLYRDRITSGCGSGLYCPDNPVTRSQMAVFLERMGRGTDRWPPNVVDVHLVLKDNGSPDPVASGQALLAAVASIPPGLPSGDNPVVVRIGPGSYALGGAKLELPGFVYLHGAGRYVTRIYSNADTPEPVRLKGFTEIKELSIELSSQVGAAIALVVEANTGLRLLEADVSASAAATVADGIAIATSSVYVERSKVSGSLSGGTGYGIYTSGPTPGSVTVHDSYVVGTTHAVYANGAYGVNLDDTMLSGALYKGASASFRCRQVYSTTYTTLACP